jgi:hypothetical protein
MIGSTPGSVTARWHRGSGCLSYPYGMLGNAEGSGDLQFYAVDPAARDRLRATGLVPPNSN